MAVWPVPATSPDRPGPLGATAPSSPAACQAHRGESVTPASGSPRSPRRSLLGRPSRKRIRTTVRSRSVNLASRTSSDIRSSTAVVESSPAHCWAMKSPTPESESIDGGRQSPAAALASLISDSPTPSRQPTSASVGRSSPASCRSRSAMLMAARSSWIRRGGRTSHE